MFVRSNFNEPGETKMLLLELDKARAIIQSRGNVASRGMNWLNKLSGLECGGKHQLKFEKKFS